MLASYNGALLFVEDAVDGLLDHFHLDIVVTQLEAAWHNNVLSLRIVFDLFSILGSCAPLYGSQEPQSRPPCHLESTVANNARHP